MRSIDIAPWITMRPHDCIRWLRARDCTIVLAPRTQAANAIVSALKCASAESRFCWYARAWRFDAPPDRAQWVRAHQLVEALFRPEPIPRSWAGQWVVAQQGRALHHDVVATADGYQIRVPATSQALYPLINLAEEMGDDAHVEWSSRGCEWICRRNDVHRQLRALLLDRGFRVRSLPLQMLVDAVRVGAPDPRQAGTAPEGIPRLG